MTADRLVPVADVVKAVGLKGEVKLYPLLDFHAPLLASRYLRWRDGGTVEFERGRPSGGCVVAKFVGCDDRDAAEAMVGRELVFDREDYLAQDFPRPPEGLPFRYLGRPVVTTTGEPVGTVDEVRRYAAQVILVVQRAGREVMIPAVAPILRPDAGLEGPLVVDPPAGLLDVGADALGLPDVGAEALGLPDVGADAPGLPDGVDD
jgi:16S rRNA processing protein RimM